mgnify:FL=1
MSEEEKKIGLWFKITVRIRHRILYPIDCYLFGHEEAYEKGMNFCVRCLKKI